MKQLISYLLVLVFIFTGILSAQQQKQKDSPKRGAELFKMLNLTTEQEKHFKDIRYEQQKKAIDLRSQIQKNRLEINQMVDNNNVDEKKILSLTDANSKIQAELKNSAVKSWLSFHKVLTPEQQEIWAKHFNGMRGKMRDGFEDRMKHRFNDRSPMRSERNYNKEPMGMMDFENDEEFFGMFEPDEMEPPMEPEL